MGYGHKAGQYGQGRTLILVPTIFAGTHLRTLKSFLSCNGPCPIGTFENSPAIHCRDLMSTQFFSPIGTTGNCRERNHECEIPISAFTFKEEYLDFLKKNEVSYDERYIWV